MAGADSTPTTRRNFVRLASAAAGAAVLPTPALAEDAELVNLSERLIYATAEIEEAAARSDEEEAQAIYRQGSAIFDRIWELEATSLAGIQAKCRALFWLHGDDRELWDCEYTFDLIDEILSIAAQAGR